MEMTLDEFVASESIRLDKFQRMWREEHKASGDDWPIVMDPGEWDEQLQVFSAAE